MKLHPASYVLELEWPVEPLLRAIELGEPWTEPAREPKTILVWRRNMQVFYRAIQEPEHAGLARAREGAPFADICEAIAGASDAAEPATLIDQLLNRWIADGVLVSDRQPSA
jgi:hypothetical protein